MIRNIFTVSLLTTTVICSAVAGTMGEPQLSNLSPVYLGAYGGYGGIERAYGQDGQFAQARLALGSRFYAYEGFMLGLELAVQSGDTLRLKASPAIIDAAGGLPIQSTLKPLVDLLVTVKGQFPSYSPLSYQLKGGIAYRQLDLNDRSSVKDSIGRVNGEFQAGLGYNVSEHAMVTAFYQGIYGSNRHNIRLNAINDITLHSIPTQQAGFLGVEYTF